MFNGFILFSFLDLVTTFVALSIGGSEANPIARVLIAEHGFLSLFVFKFLVVLLIAFSEPFLGKIEAWRNVDKQDYDSVSQYARSYFTEITLFFGCLATGLAVVNNSWVIISLMQL